jgi:hypothetical protein
VIVAGVTLAGSLTQLAYHAVLPAIAGARTHLALFGRTIPAESAR